MSHQILRLGPAAALCWLILPGCADGTATREIPRTHPAHAQAPESPFELPPNVLEAGYAIPEIVLEGETAVGELVRLSDDGAVELAKLIDAYVTIGDRLAGDSVEGLAGSAEGLRYAATSLSESEVAGHPHFWHERAEFLGTVDRVASELASADLKPARLAYARLSDALEGLLKSVDLPGGDEGLHAFVCGMFKEAPRQGVWLQRSGEPRNPYFGAKMLHCHAERYRLPTGSGEDRGRGHRHGEGEE